MEMERRKWNQEIFGMYRMDRTYWLKNWGWGGEECVWDEKKK